MKPVSPIVKGFEDLEMVLGKIQTQYQPLPVLWCRDSTGTVISRWKLTWAERIRLFVRGELYLRQLTFSSTPVSGKFQPQLPSVDPPELSRG
jgi:hypothetical protein